MPLAALKTQERTLDGRRHTLVMEPFRGRIIVRAGGVILADSRAAIRVSETGRRVLYYLPRADVAATQGPAWRGPGAIATPRVQCAKAPFAQAPFAKSLAGHVSFDPEAVEVMAINPLW